MPLRKYRPMRKYAPNKKEEPTMPEEPMAPEEPVYIPEPKTVAPETMKGLEKHATLAERVTTQRMKELEELAGMDFIPHHAPQVGYEYVWEKGGKHYSLKVMMAQSFGLINSRRYYQEGSDGADW